MTTAVQRGAFGPWLPNVGQVERCAQLRSLAALATVFLGCANPIVMALRRAEQDDAELARAYALLDALPSIPKRRLLSTFAAVNSAGAHP